MLDWHFQFAPALNSAMNENCLHQWVGLSALQHVLTC